jgi:CelD/BcsL family acetyltransferase involved in cellulose biosynthesis
MDNPESRQTLMLAAQKKLLLAYVLSVHGQPSAFVIGRTYHNTFHVQYMGYDTRLSRFSVGTFLLMHCIEDAMSKAVSGVDFGVGNQRYKRSVSNRVEQKARLHLFGPSLKGLALNCACSVLNFVLLAARRFLRATGLYEQFKNFWYDLRLKRYLRSTMQAERSRAHADAQ